MRSRRLRPRPVAFFGSIAVIGGAIAACGSTAPASDGKPPSPALSITAQSTTPPSPVATPTPTPQWDAATTPQVIVSYPSEWTEHEEYLYPQLQGPGGERVIFSGPTGGTWDVPTCAQYAYTGIGAPRRVEEQITVDGIATTEYSSADARGMPSYAVGVYFPSNGGCERMVAVANGGNLEHAVVDQIFRSARYPFG
jgi:hypothetical protein